MPPTVFSRRPFKPETKRPILALRRIVMSLRKLHCGTLLVILFALASCGTTAFGQGAEPVAQRDTKNDETNLDTQLYLLIATNQEVEEGKVPTALEPVVKQLRSSLPFRNYRLAATLINRVKNEGRLNLQWVGGPLLASTAVASASTPSFNEFKVNSVRLTTDAGGHDMVRMDGFRFGARIPIQTVTGVASNAPAPIINYENTGLNTDISMREGEPVIVGTLNLGPSGDAIILVMTARRSSR
jgi:hypothetical protein